MNKMKILVVEDEIIIADNLCDALNDLGYDVFEPAISFTETMESLEKNLPDLVMLDIHLSGKKSGIDVARVLNEKYKIPFIFLTSFADSKTIQKAKEVQPVAYLVKPFSKEELYASIEIGLSNYSQIKTEDKELPIINRNALFIKQNQMFVKILFSEILYIQSEHVYIEIYMEGGQMHLVRSSLSDIISKLGTEFLRVHRRFIVNLDLIAAFDHDLIRIGDKNIPIGNSYKEVFLQRINLI